MRDSLVAFSKQYNRKVYLKKNTAVSDDINLYIFFDDIPGYTPIVYDSALQRRDYDLTRTEGLIVPKGLVENFKSSAYHFISCENGQVFFGYKQDNQEIFAREVAFIGILTPFTGEVGKESKRISSDAVITNRYSP